MKQAEKDITAATRLPLLELNAKYFVDPSAQINDLLEDASMLLDGAIATANALAIGLSDDDSDFATNPAAASRILWGTYHALNLTQGIVIAAIAQAKQ